MSIDRSLKTASGLARHRNVLSRAERVAKLSRGSKFNPEKDSPLGLPKVGNRKVVAGGKASKKGPATDAAGEADAKAK